MKVHREYMREREGAGRKGKRGGGGGREGATEQSERIRDKARSASLEESELCVTPVTQSELCP